MKMTAIKIEKACEFGDCGECLACIDAEARERSLRERLDVAMAIVTELQRQYREMTGRSYVPPIRL